MAEVAIAASAAHFYAGHAKTFVEHLFDLLFIDALIKAWPAATSVKFGVGGK